MMQIQRSKMLEKLTLKIFLPDSYWILEIANAAAAVAAEHRPRRSLARAPALRTPRVFLLPTSCVFSSQRLRSDLGS